MTNTGPLTELLKEKFKWPVVTWEQGTLSCKEEEFSLRDLFDVPEHRASNMHNLSSAAQCVFDVLALRTLRLAESKGEDADLTAVRPYFGWSFPDLDHLQRSYDQLSPGRKRDKVDEKIDALRRPGAKLECMKKIIDGLYLPDEQDHLMRLATQQTCLGYDFWLAINDLRNVSGRLTRYLKLVDLHAPALIIEPEKELLNGIPLLLDEAADKIQECRGFMRGSDFPTTGRDADNAKVIDAALDQALSTLRLIKIAHAKAVTSSGIDSGYDRSV